MELEPWRRSLGLGEGLEPWRGNWGLGKGIGALASELIRQTCPGHVVRVRVRGMAAPPAKGSQEHLGASRGIRKPLETGKVLGEGSKTYFIHVLIPSILIKSVWFLHHHGGGRVESLVKE